MENQLDDLYAKSREARGVTKLKLTKAINRLEQTLSWQGANPKVLPFAELREHIQAPVHEDGIDNKYQARVSNRATGIRAYCVQCQGGYTAGVRECATMVCPLHPFRMGTDPLRGYELPKPQIVDIPDEDGDDATLFEDGDDDADDDTGAVE